MQVVEVLQNLQEIVGDLCIVPVLGVLAEHAVKAFFQVFSSRLLVLREDSLDFLVVAFRDLVVDAELYYEDLPGKVFQRIVCGHNVLLVRLEVVSLDQREVMLERIRVFAELYRIRVKRDVPKAVRERLFVLEKLGVRPHEHFLQLH